MIIRCFKSFLLAICLLQFTFGVNAAMENGSSVPNYDVIVIGLGAMGSAATYQLAKANVKVLGIDSHNPPHEFGSSYGDSRITRLAIGEGAEFVPLALRSQQIWRQIEAESKRTLLVQTGGLIMSVPSEQDKHGVSNFLQQTIDAANTYHIAHSELSAAQIRKKYPEFKLTGKESAYYEPEAGYLKPDECITAQLELAKKYGAQIHTDEKVLSFKPTESLVTVKTTQGSYTARKLIITAGPWVVDLLPQYKQIFKVYRQTLYWFALKDPNQYAQYNKLPVFVWLYGTKQDDFIYGFPAINGPQGGLKLATESYTAETTPDMMERKVSDVEITSMYDKIKSLIPGLAPKCIKAVSCLYTVTPDYKFVIDFLPDHKNIIVASPCSGHGFKHSAAIGEVLMQLATTGQSKIDISSFGFARFPNFGE